MKLGPLSLLLMLVWTPGCVAWFLFQDKDDHTGSRPDTGVVRETGPVPEPLQSCEEACAQIQVACGTIDEAACRADCEQDLRDCPNSMQRVLNCMVGADLECDPEQDQNLAESPCDREHDAVHACGHDPF